MSRCWHAGVPPSFQRAAAAMYCKGPLAAPAIAAALWPHHENRMSLARMLLGRMRRQGLARQLARGFYVGRWTPTPLGTRVGRGAQRTRSAKTARRS